MDILFLIVICCWTLWVFLFSSSEKWSTSQPSWLSVFVTRVQLGTAKVSLGESGNSKWGGNASHCLFVRVFFMSYDPRNVKTCWLATGCFLVYRIEMRMKTTWVGKAQLPFYTASPALSNRAGVLPCLENLRSVPVKATLLSLHFRRVLLNRGKRHHGLTGLE